MKIIYLLFTILVTIGTFACKDHKENSPKIIDQKKLEEPLKKFNKEMVTVEDLQIDDYLTRRGWKMNRSQTGLRYIIYKNGTGLKPESGQIVVLKYSTSLIRGEEVYNSDRDGKKIFKVDQSEEISGLHELVKYLKVGDQCKAVVPSYLAYGLLGDAKKIPRKATLFMDVQLIQIR